MGSFTALIDVAIGLTLLYLGASLFVTVANEYLGQLSDLRAKHLEQALLKLLNKDGLEKLMESPLLQSRPKVPGRFSKNKPLAVNKELVNGDGRRATYVDPVVLAKAMIGLAKPSGQSGITMDALVKGIDAIPGETIKEALTALSRSAVSVEGFAKDVEQWVDRQLKLLGESYKMSAQLMSFILGIVIAVCFNIDTLEATDQLYRDKQLRERLAVAAERFAKPDSSPQFQKCLAMKPDEQKKAEECKPYRALMEDIGKGGGVFAGLPIGWTSWAEVGQRAVPGANLDWIRHWIGWLLTALAISIGAPFWFDFLNRLVNVRHGIRRPEPEPSHR